MPAAGHLEQALPQRAGPLAPKVASCTPPIRDKLLAAYRVAFGWVRAAARWLRSLAGASNLAKAWSASPLAKLLGPYSTQRLRRFVRLVRGVLDRFEHGFEDGDRRRRATLACFSATYRRCRKGLLGNASIYATLRFCPRLLAGDVASIAKVVLHEMMHQRLGVGDQQHADCTGSKHRCYRESARTLVTAGRYDLATRNIDNYVLLIRRLGGGG